ncbi:methyl-accepting chemotaxis protein [Halorussus limi]|uniref:Methyl-accepting chemotaxis protein n=1 Tax=Halorussus limi TaxID=2938695 RepID=A0A8U0HSM6_9EURY|nr:methyl-accepting chemotaxis protein [Halorussus limi]UPV74000.1 methyl-accepting chemotaxis protein [Halorussus limi]
MSKPNRKWLDGLTTRIERLLPARLRQSYAAKFGAVLLGVVLLMLVVGVYVQVQAGDIVREDTRAEISGAATDEAEALQKWVTRQRSTTRFLADSVGREMSTAERRALVEREFIDLSSEVQAIHYVDTSSGEVLASTTDSTVGTTPSASQAAWAGGSVSFDAPDDVVVTAPYRVGEEPVVAFATPTGEPNRMLVLTASLAERSHDLSSPTATGDIKVVNEDGTIVFDNRNNRLLKTYAGDSSVIQKGLVGESGVSGMPVLPMLDSGGNVRAYTPVVGTDWVLLYHVPTSDALAVQSNVSENILLMVLATVLGLALVGVTIGRGTARSLTEVADTADEIASGKLDVELPETTRDDEMGRLFESFESMRRYLNTVADQADALANQNFDADAFDESVPGTFGESLAQMRHDLEEMVTNIEQARAEAQSAKAEAEEMNDALERKAAEFGDVMERAAAGDLTQRMDPGSESEAMTEIAEEFNAMIAQLESTIADVSEFAETVAASSQEVTASTAEIEDASQQVSESTQVMSSAAEDQSDRLDATAGEMNDLSATIEEVAASADQVAQAATHTEELGQQGREAAQAAIDEMQRIESGTESTVAQMEELESDIARIGEVVELIRSIAEQTNMLALNANIEAANTDGSSDGFEVVANEVKDLANETKDAVGDIDDRIEDIQSGATRTVEDVRETREAVSEGTQTVREAQEALEEIVDNVEETTDGVREISDAADDQSTTTQEVVGMVDEITDISDETADEATDIAAATEEQTASLRQVSRSAEELAEKAESLAATVDRFEVHRERDPVAPRN